MKFKVFFIKKKHICYLTLILLVLMFFIIFTNLKSKDISYPTFSINLAKESYKADFTGDGKEDVLYITTSKDKYYLQVTTQKNSSYIQPNKTIKTLGTYKPYWRAKVKLLDINRDKIPEIFIQASEKNTPIQHAFVYNNGKFETLLSSRNNVLGFIDSSNNKTPKLVSGNISQGNLKFYNYILIQNQLKKYNYNYEENFAGRNAVLSFIDLITSSGNSSSMLDKKILSNNIDESSLSVISALTNSNTSYSFQDAQFIDTKSDTDGNASEVQWILNFRGISNDNQHSIKNYTIKILLESDLRQGSNSYYKITSLSQIQQN